MASSEEIRWLIIAGGLILPACWLWDRFGPRRKRGD